MYRSAPCNAIYSPEIHIGDGHAEVSVAVTPSLFHAGGAVHGSVYFKLMDDASFFAVNSVVRNEFVLTVSFNVYFTRPVTSGAMRAVGKIVHRSSRLFLAEAEVFDERGRSVGRGSGSFMKSAVRLTPELGYQ